MKENPENEPFKQMVINWKASYLSQVDEAGNNDCLVKDFLEEIEERILPHVENAGFSGWAFGQVQDLKRLIEEIESSCPSTESMTATECKQNREQS